MTQRSPAGAIRNIGQISGLAELADGYDALLCDVWGVVHNGVCAYSHALEALCAFRKDHGPVVLITNAPVPAALVERRLDGLSVPRTAYDAM